MKIYTIQQNKLLIQKNEHFAYDGDCCKEDPSN
jgi:hypothetical protein